MKWTELKIHIVTMWEMISWHDPIYITDTIDRFTKTLIVTKNWLKFYKKNWWQQPWISQKRILYKMYDSWLLNSWDAVINNFKNFKELMIKNNIY